ncbi:MAG TPA: hypothetical protein PKV71_15230, partial [Calditrichia bacterium]|nr:hypothetical protein [Calditrichia bacterium]
GTEVVNKIYPLLRFTVPIQIPRFIKVLKPLPYLKALNNPLWKRVAKTAYYSKGLFAGQAASGLQLVPHSGEDFLPAIPSDTVVNRELRPHLDWLKRAPGVTPYLLTLQQGGLPKGTALVYTRTEGDIVSGRIVHLSFLGEDPALWRGAISLLENFLAEKGSCIVTTMASHPLFSNALLENGHNVVKESPLWLRDKPKRFRNDNIRWHFTYLEGDLAWRDVHISDFRRPTLSA